MSTSLQAHGMSFSQAERALFYHEINLGVNIPIFYGTRMGRDRSSPGDKLNPVGATRLPGQGRLVLQKSC